MEIKFLGETAEINEIRKEYGAWERNRAWHERYYSTWSISDSEGEIVRLSLEEVKQEWKTRVQRRARKAKFERRAIPLVAFSVSEKGLQIGKPFKAYAVPIPRNLVSNDGYYIYNVNAPSRFDVREPKPLYCWTPIKNDIVSGIHRIHMVEVTDYYKVGVVLWNEVLFAAIEKLASQLQKRQHVKGLVGKSADVLIKASQSPDPVLSLAKEIL